MNRREWDRFKIQKRGGRQELSPQAQKMDRTHSSSWFHNAAEKPHHYLSQRKATLPHVNRAGEPELFASFGRHRKEAQITAQGFSTFGEAANLKAQIEAERTLADWKMGKLPYDPYMSQTKRSTSHMLANYPDA